MPITRRHMLALGAGAMLSPIALRAETAAGLPERLLPRWVDVRAEFAPGTIHVVPQIHHLYLVTSPRRAIRYGVGVGGAGRDFRGTATIERKAEWPSWRPTDAMIARDPERYARFADGLPGGLENPLGARALYLGSTLYRIHGTNEPWSIGRAMSSGCIRMMNEDVIDLYQRVRIGTRVVVI